MGGHSKLFFTANPVKKNFGCNSMKIQRKTTGNPVKCGVSLVVFHL